MVGVACFLVNVFALADDPVLKTTWDSEYTTEQNARIQATVRLRKDPAEQLGSGKYESTYNGQSVGAGTLSQVRVDVKNRESSPLPSPGTPLPGPSSPLGGVSNLNQTKFVKGLWHFGNESGWFKWELYEANGKCFFAGTWGDLVNNTQGPTKGTWKGTLQQGGGPVSPPVGGGGVVPID